MILSDAILKMLGRLSYLSYHYESEPEQRDLALHALRDGFSADQVASKIALIRGLSYAFSAHRDHPNHATVVGSWFGLTQMFLNDQFSLPCHGIDIQPFWAWTKPVLSEINQGNTFEAIDALDYRIYPSAAPDLVVNTICEHMPADDFETWLASTVPRHGAGRFLALQSNDMFDVETHVNCSQSLEVFVQDIQRILSGKQRSTILTSEIDLPGIKKKRFQWIGYLHP